MYNVAGNTHTCFFFFLQSACSTLIIPFLFLYKGCKNLFTPLEVCEFLNIEPAWLNRFAILSVECFFFFFSIRRRKREKTIAERDHKSCPVQDKVEDGVARFQFSKRWFPFCTTVEFVRKITPLFRPKARKEISKVNLSKDFNFF